MLICIFWECFFLKKKKIKSYTCYNITLVEKLLVCDWETLFKVVEYRCQNIEPGFNILCDIMNPGFNILWGVQNIIWHQYPLIQICYCKCQGTRASLFTSHWNHAVIFNIFIIFQVKNMDSCLNWIHCISYKKCMYKK